jgi:hypothetical protein
VGLRHTFLGDTIQLSPPVVTCSEEQGFRAAQVSIGALFQDVGKKETGLQGCGK